MNHKITTFVITIIILLTPYSVFAIHSYEYYQLSPEMQRLIDDAEDEAYSRGYDDAKDEAYSKAWTYLKDSNERWNNDYVSHKANANNKYAYLYQRYLRAADKANLFISICKAYEDRSNILRTLNANLRKTL